jgi:hypothetical protein
MFATATKAEITATMDMVQEAIAFCAQKKMGDYSEIIAWVTDFLMRSMQ